MCWIAMDSVDWIPNFLIPMYPLLDNVLLKSNVLLPKSLLIYNHIYCRFRIKTVTTYFFFSIDDKLLLVGFDSNSYWVFLLLTIVSCFNLFSVIIGVLSPLCCYCLIFMSSTISDHENVNDSHRLKCTDDLNEMHFNIV